MAIDRVDPSVALGHQQNVAGSSAAQALLQKVKPGYWASPAGSSTLTHRTTTSAKKSARTLIREVTAERDRGALREKLADAFRKADPGVREAMRATTRYHNIVQAWAKDLVRAAWNGPRTTIHQGDQAMRELHRVLTALPPELAADLVIAAAPVFVDCSRTTKDNPAIFSSNDRVLVSIPSPAEEAPEPGPEASTPDPNVEASTPNPDVDASKPIPDVEVSKPTADVEPSMPNPDVEAQNRALTLKLQSRNMRITASYLSDLKAWIGGAEIPNPKQDDAIRKLEALVDKS